MPVDANIALGLKPVQLENPLNNMVKFANIQNDMSNMDRHRQQTEAATAAAARQNELNNYLGSGGRDPNRIYQLGGQEALNHINQADSAKITSEKVSGETLDAAIKRGRGLFQDFVHTPEQARQFTYMQFTDPVMKKYMESLGVSFEQAVARIPKDPAEFRNYREQYVVGMDKHLDNLAFKNPHDVGNRIDLTNSRGEVGGRTLTKGPTMQQRIETNPEILSGLANQDTLRQQIAQGNPGGVASQTNQLLNASVAQANDQTAPPISPLAANVNRQEAELAGVNATLRANQERALAAKQNPDAKLALINDYYTRINNGEDPNSESMKARKGQIDFNQTRAEPAPFMVLDKDGNLRSVDKKKVEVLGMLPGVGKPQQDIVQKDSTGKVIQDKRMTPAMSLIVSNQTASMDNLQNAIKQVQLHPGGFGAQNYLLPDAVIQRTDPAGVTARAGVANLSSMKIHDRSGAAVTVGEIPRLRPFIPNVGDEPSVVVSKMRDLLREMKVENDAYLKTISGQGYFTGEPAAPPAEATAPHAHPKGTGLDKTNPRLQ